MFYPAEAKFSNPFFLRRLYKKTFRRKQEKSFISRIVGILFDGENLRKTRKKYVYLPFSSRCESDNIRNKKYQKQKKKKLEFSDGISFVVIQQSTVGFGGIHRLAPNSVSLS